jgi:hypothetical protein
MGFVLTSNSIKLGIFIWDKSTISIYFLIIWSFLNRGHPSRPLRFVILLLIKISYLRFGKLFPKSIEVISFTDICSNDKD